MIEAIRFKNCMSLRDCTMAFATDKPNIIIADNNTGKSVLYRILKLAGCSSYYSKEDRKDLITRGADFASVTFKFTDGSFALMRILPDKTIYGFLRDANDKLVASLEPPPEMIEHLGLLVSETDAFIANIIDMDQDLLLVNPKLNSNYELVKMLATCEDLDGLQEKLISLTDEFKRKKIRISDSLNVITQQLAELEFYNVDELEKKKVCIATLSDVLFKSCSVYENIEKVQELQDNADWDNLIALTDILDSLENVSGVFPSLSKKVSKPDFSDLEALEFIEAVREQLDKLNVPKQPNEDLIECITFLSELELIIPTLEAHKKCVETAKAFPDDYAELVDTLECIEELAHLLSNLNNLDLTAVEESIEMLQTQFENSGDKYNCPIYGEVVFDGKECVAGDY